MTSTSAPEPRGAESSEEADGREQQLTPDGRHGRQPARPPAGGADPAGEDAQRARVVVIALVALALVIAATAVAAGFFDDGKPTDPSTAVEGYEGRELASPQIIPKPNSGHAPEDSGDRGGWAQLTLLGLVVVAVGGIGYVVVRGTRRSRANRNEWLAAARSDHDGVLDDRNG